MEYIAKNKALRGTRRSWKESTLSKYLQQGAVLSYIWELIMLWSILGHPGQPPQPQASHPYWHSTPGSFFAPRALKGLASWAFIFDP